jgi:hypothetical protein
MQLICACLVSAMSESSVGLACLRDPPSTSVATSSSSNKRGAPSHSVTSSTSSRSGDHRGGGGGGGGGGGSSDGSDMYVTLNSAAQHSPDTVWTLPGEQQLPDSTPLLSSREVEAVVDAMEESPMPQFETDEDAEVQASTARAKAESKDLNSSRGNGNFSRLDLSYWMNDCS